MGDIAKVGLLCCVMMFIVMLAAILKSQRVEKLYRERRVSVVVWDKQTNSIQTLYWIHTDQDSVPKFKIDTERYIVKEVITN